MSKIGKTIAMLGVVAGLGVACLPLSSYALDDSESMNVVLKVKDAISLELSGGEGFTPATAGSEGVEAAIAKLNLGDLSADGELHSAAVTATVSTTHADGYNLTIKGTATDLVKEGANANGAKIEALTGGEDFDDLSTIKESRWGYKTSGDVTAWTGITTNAKQIKTSTGPVVNEGTEVTFGVVVVEGQEEGTYSGTVTLTATANS